MCYAYDCHKKSSDIAYAWWRNVLGQAGYIFHIPDDSADMVMGSIGYHTTYRQFVSPWCSVVWCALNEGLWWTDLALMVDGGMGIRNWQVSDDEQLKEGGLGADGGYHLTWLGMRACVTENILLVARLVDGEGSPEQTSSDNNEWGELFLVLWSTNVQEILLYPMHRTSLKKFRKSCPHRLSWGYRPHRSVYGCNGPSSVFGLSWLRPDRGRPHQKSVG